MNINRRRFLKSSAAFMAAASYGDISKAYTYWQQDLNTLDHKIKVIGVGGAGGNIVSNMIEAEVLGVEFIAAGTDIYAPDRHNAAKKIYLGRGSCAEGYPEYGKRGAEENADIIADAVKGADIAFIVAGMGGETGTGAAPVIARIAQECGVLVVALVTTPFNWDPVERRCY